jgi:hypothetical protein
MSLKKSWDWIKFGKRNARRRRVGNVARGEIRTIFFPLKRMSNRRCNADGRLRAKLYPFRETASEKATGAFPSWARRNQKRIVCRIRHSFFYLGRITESMMWMTPFLHSMSAVVTVAPSTLTPVEASIVTLAPLTVAASLSLTTSPDITLPATTW